MHRASFDLDDDLALVVYCHASGTTQLRLRTLNLRATVDVMLDRAQLDHLSRILAQAAAVHDADLGRPQP